MFEIDYSIADSRTIGSFDGRISVPPVFRPIQYLGSKLRSLSELIEATSGLFGSGDSVFDLFSGSSVVSQAFALQGARVTSVDAQRFCQHLAAATLGEQRVAGEKSAPVAARIAEQLLVIDFPSELTALLAEETRSLATGPSVRLAEFYAAVPQVWRNADAHCWLQAASAQQGQYGFNEVPIIASHYAGTYFGLRQALFFDYIRNEIQRLHEKHEISEWVQVALLSSLYSAMSKAVCSAGKHFAQPLGKTVNANTTFFLSRLYSDRSADVGAIFIEASHRIDEVSASLGSGHVAIDSPVEDIYSRIIIDQPALIYADPPYTAQQYSRFYHVLEVVAKYVVPHLQIQSGTITRGLYNMDRYKSDFSSKSKAAKSFDLLIHTARRSGSSLAISYSSSSALSVGNSRMIQLKELMHLCEKHYGRSKVHLAELSHVYRQFNAAQKSNAHRNDPEILILCEA